jgi:hypothetical protein
MKAALASVVLTTAVLSGSAAEAVVYFNTSAGASCQASSGAAAQYFYFASTYAQNIGTRSLYLTCDLPVFNYVPSPPYTGIKSPLQVTVQFMNATPDSTITFACVVQAGVPGFVVNTTFFTVNVRDVAGVTLYDPGEYPGTPPVSLPDQPDNYSAWTLNCMVPPQGRMGLLHVLLYEEFNHL